MISFKKNYKITILSESLADIPFFGSKSALFIPFPYLIWKYWFIIFIHFYFLTIFSFFFFRVFDIETTLNLLNYISHHIFLPKSFPKYSQIWNLQDLGGFPHSRGHLFFSVYEISSKFSPFLSHLLKPSPQANFL